MTCTPTTLPDGTRAIVCTTTKHCSCGRPAKLECDWKVMGRPSGTCDKLLCGRCTYSPAEGNDLCPAHASDWKALLAARTRA
jgi:hypothetical protein